MSVPNVDTFEHDIAEEIRTKEASLTDIASAGGDVKNTTPVQTSNMLVIVGLIFIVTVIGLIAFIVYLEVTPTTPTPQQGTGATTDTLPKGSTIGTLSATISDAIGPSLGPVTKSDYGYAIKVLSYPEVYSYMFRNESKYADELAISVGSPRDKTSTTSLPFSFTDTTLSNQNMRVGTSGSSTVVYAFVNTNTLLVASSTSAILQLRSAILAK